MSPPPVALRARQLGIDVSQPALLHEPEALEQIAAAEPEVVIVCAYGVLIKEPLLSAYEMINVHPSLLPRWRGRRRSSARSWPATNRPACRSCA